MCYSYYLNKKRSTGTEELFSTVIIFLIIIIVFFPPLLPLSFSCLSAQGFHLDTILPFFSNFCPTSFLLICFHHQFCPPYHSSLCFCSCNQLCSSSLHQAAWANSLQNCHLSPSSAFAPGFLHLSFSLSSCFPEQLFPLLYKTQMAKYRL